MSDKLQFGVGCFHLGVKCESRQIWTGKKYKENVRLALESIPSISNITVTSDEEFDLQEFQVDKALSTIGEGSEPFPLWWSLETEFDVFIPARIQTELTYGDMAGDLVKTERIHVVLTQGYEMPVAFIHLLEAKETLHVSDYVQVVREFLKREFDTRDIPHISFEYLGPSPLHADFEIVLSPSPPLPFGRSGVSVTLEKRSGYDLVLIYCDDDRCDTKKSALHVVSDLLRDELSFYYFIRRIRTIRIHRWTELQEIIAQLRDLVNQPGLRAFVRRLIRTRGLIDNAFAQLIEFEGDEVFQVDQLRRGYAHLYRTGDQHLREIIDSAHLESDEYPKAQVERLIDLLESRRVKAADAIVLLASAVLGGTVGSMITRLLSP